MLRTLICHMWDSDSLQTVAGCMWREVMFKRAKTTIKVGDNLSTYPWFYLTILLASRAQKK